MLLMDCCSGLVFVVVLFLVLQHPNINIVAAAAHHNVKDLPYNQNYYIPNDPWMKGHVQVLDNQRQLNVSLDKYTGSAGFNSWNKYGSGCFTMRIKMPKKDSTAIITTFYLQSENYEERDEIDFELLGATGSGKNKGSRPTHYVILTNVFVNGSGGREQKMGFWFNPTADFHNYTLLWNSHQIVFLVDDMPIRVFKNRTKDGGQYPTKAMTSFGRLWNGTWASGGADVDWNAGPFVAEYRGFGIYGCQTQNPTTDPKCYSSNYNYWWNTPKYSNLHPIQLQQYNHLRTNYLLYDYCSHTHAPECQYHHQSSPLPLPTF